MCDGHPWTLTAPWWHWPAVGTPNRNVRKLPPVLQKYDSSDPVTAFVKEPQRSLRYDDKDRVQTLTLPGPVGTRASYTGGTLAASGTRKLFLPIHKRFYLVVVELHCDSPGFPSVAREKACEVGMVIRRRRLSVGSQHSARAVEILRGIGEATAKIASIDRRMEKRVLKKRTQKGFGASGGATGLMTKSKVDAALNAAAVAERAKLEAELAAARQQLLAWQTSSGATVLKEGWVASDFENVGSWQVVEEEPQGTSEVIYPLYPLIPDPRNPDHDANGKTIWFGMLPTGTREVEANGKARFDEDSRYEVRCFVRRHECECPVATERNDCGGELVWSAPTETFQLAGHFDVHGAGNHPITIQMPDIPALAAAAAAGDAQLPVAMKFPAGSALNFGVDKDKQQGTNPSTNGLPQICYFSIPLITIIATFVLNLFLPIVVFLFQLWFLLGLKFCILPSISIAVGLDAAIQGQLDAQLTLAAKLDAAIDVSAGVALETAIAANMNLAITGNAMATVNASGNVVPGAGFSTSPGASMAAALDTAALVELNAAATENRKAEVDGRSIVAGMDFEERVERAEVAA